MKSTHAPVLLLLAGLVLTAACNKPAAPPPAAPAAAPVSGGLPSLAARVVDTSNATPAAGSAASQEPTAQGKVLETMSTAGYTYVRIQGPDGKDIWGAAPEFQVKVGDEVVVPLSMPMENYESKTLKRKFDLVYFAGAITPPGQAPPAAPGQAATPDASQMMMAHGSMAMAKAPAGPIDLKGIEKAPGGYTVAEVHAQADALAGKTVAVRGRVVKYTPAVMKHNWLHVRDGSAEDETGDLTVTTDDEAAIGDLVLVRGVVATKQDFGAGYAYAVLLQDAKVEAQPQALPAN